MNSKIATILEQPMDRQSFLKHIGLGAIMLFGVSKLVDAFGLQAQAGPVPGYGDTDYGK